MEHVHRDLKKRRARNSTKSGTDAHLHVFADPRSLIAGFSPFRYWLYQRNMVHFLQRAASCVTKWSLPADDQDWRISPPRIRYTRDPVSNTRPRSKNCYTNLSRMEASPSISSMNSSLFVSDTDNFNTPVEAPVI